MLISDRLPPRDWEFCFRAGEFLLHCMADEDDVRSRRAEHFKRRLLSASRGEAAQFSDDTREHARALARRWCQLFDEWAKDPALHVFPDGYAALFFLSVLYANVNVLLRGQVDATWKIATSLSRWREKKGQKATAHALRAAKRFVGRISDWTPLKAQYPNGLRAEHAEAICQHYGFPTEYLDVTFGYDVALFFAEDWKLLGREPMPQDGAIFAVPVHKIVRDSTLVTLPPVVSRPNLQKGKFLRGDSRDLLTLLEQHKFTYRHAEWPIARGLSQAGFEYPPLLKDYLYPRSDRLEDIARDFRSWERT